MSMIKCHYCEAEVDEFFLVQHTWHHRQLLHKPLSSVSCPNCQSNHIKVAAPPEGYDLRYLCLGCHHLFDANNNPPLTQEQVQIVAQGAIDSLGNLDLQVGRAMGVKLDSGKPDLWMHLFDNFPRAIREVALHCEEGDAEEGHVHGGWAEVPNGYDRYSAALLRHLLEEVEVAKPREWGRQVRSARAVAVNALIRLEILLRKDVTYDNPSSSQVGRKLDGLPGLQRDDDGGNGGKVSTGLQPGSAK